MLILGEIGSIVNALVPEPGPPSSKISFQVEIIWKYITAREPVLMVMGGVLVVLWMFCTTWISKSAKQHV